MPLDGVLAVHDSYAGRSVGAGHCQVDQVAHIRLECRIDNVSPVPHIADGTHRVGGAGSHHDVSLSGSRLQTVKVIKINPHDLGATLPQSMRNRRAGMAGGCEYP